MYFHGTLEERNGEQEYTHNFLIKAKNEKAAEERLDLEARQFYSGDIYIDDGGYYFEDGTIFVEAGSLTLTTKKEFVDNLLSTHLITT